MNRFKYPRTFHLPWSGGVQSDDKVLKDLSHFEGQDVVVTEKMDGENTTLYPDSYVHARSIDSKYHQSRTWIRGDWASKSYLLDEKRRICGENLYAKHSVEYKALESYFYGFSVWEGDLCLDWDTSENIIRDFGYPTPRVLYRGIWDSKKIESIEIDENIMEGYVVRLASGFHDFRSSVAKYVRKDHVQTDSHWMSQEVVANHIISS